MRLAIVLLAVLPLAAQDIKMPANLDKLAAKASEVVDVSLDGALLQLASLVGLGARRRIKLR